MFSLRSEAHRAGTVRFAPSLAAALLDGLCEHPANYPVVVVALQITTAIERTPSVSATCYK
ncbi:hypothetical protein NSND_61405 [Nitrospira sp. ND1]|nr:hypothetical protein NSND_61405 [Nitrospira sp. ND1]